MYIMSFCDKSTGLHVVYMVKVAITTICILVPIIMIFRTMMPFLSAIINKEKIKEDLSTLLKSFVAAFIVFLIPVATNYVFKNIIKSDYSSFSACYNTATLDGVNKLRKKEEEERLAKLEAERKEREKKYAELIEKEKKRQAEKPKNSAGKANSISDKTDYDNRTLNVVKVVDTNINNPSSGLGDGRNRYRAVQTAAYTGNYVVYAQNKNYGSIENSSKGGRVCWSELSTGKQVKCVEVGEEGGHMDGIAYDNDRGYVLKTASGGRLMEFDNSTMEFVGYAKIPQTHVGIAYVPKIGMLVGYGSGKLYFYKYNSNTNAYETDHVVQLQNFTANSTQGIGTDGTNIFIADSSPWDSQRALYTYSLTGQKLETHSFGSGFGSMSDEVESAFADNDGNLYLACPQGIGKVTNYRANKIGLPK